MKLSKTIDHQMVKFQHSFYIFLNMLLVTGGNKKRRPKDAFILCLQNHYFNVMIVDGNILALIPMSAHLFVFQFEGVGELASQYCE
jgi:hypothetical protein